MNAGQWLRNLRTLCGMTQLELRTLAGKADGWVPAIETGLRRAYLSELQDIWARVTEKGFRISAPTAELTGRRPGDGPPAPRPVITLKLGRSQGGVLLATDESAIRGFAPNAAHAPQGARRS